MRPWPLPHDLLRLAAPACLLTTPYTKPAPAWVRDSLERTPWVVVRRAACAPTTVPVGVRGPGRGQRWAAYVPRDAVCEIVRPEDLLTVPAARDLPALRAIAALGALTRPFWSTAWGPGGSVGFELATGQPAARPGSDLDLLVRAPDPVRPASVAQLLQTLTALPVRADVQIQSPWGGFAAAEYARDTGQTLLRTDTGPYPVADPWHRPEPR